MDDIRKKMFFIDQSDLYERLCKTLNERPVDENKMDSGREKSIDYFSLPLTEVTVNLIEKTISKEKRLGKLDVNYASFILHQACLSPTSIILAMIYLDRLKKFNSECLDKMTSTELFLASLIVASKFLFDKDGDEMVYNDEWASYVNVDLNDLNKLEIDFLQALKWSCFVDNETFMKQVVKFEGLISMNEYLKRKNSMTYIEMISLFKYLKHFHNDKEFVWSCIMNIFQSLLIFVAAYFIAIGIVLVSFTVVFTVQQTIRQTNEPEQLTTIHFNNISHLPIKVTFTNNDQLAKQQYYSSMENFTNIHQSKYRPFQYQQLFFKYKQIKC